MERKTPGGFIPKFPSQGPFARDSVMERLRRAHDDIVAARYEFEERRGQTPIAMLAKEVGDRVRRYVPVVREGRQRIAELGSYPAGDAFYERRALEGTAGRDGRPDPASSAVEVVDYLIESTCGWLQREGGANR